MKRKNEKADHETIGDVLQEFVKKNHLEKGLDQVDVEEAWNAELGPAVKKYTSGVKLKRNTLYVHLNNAVLREELSYGKSKIIRILNETLGKELIKELVLR